MTFSDRKTAEKFFYGLASKRVPGIEGKVEAAWVSGPTAPASSATKPGNGYGKEESNDEDFGLDRDEDIKTEQGEDPTRRDSSMARAEAPVDQGDMDYDIVDEPDWATAQ